MFVLLGFLIGASFVSAEETNLSSPGILPDSPFYFLKTWKESIQTFFLLGEANKAKQFLHLADIRMAEYQKMLEKGKTEIARKTLEKYEKQLNRAIEKTQKLQKIKKGEDILQDLGKITSKLPIPPPRESKKS